MHTKNDSNDFEIFYRFDPSLSTNRFRLPTGWPCCLKKGLDVSNGEENVSKHKSALGWPIKKPYCNLPFETQSHTRNDKIPEVSTDWAQWVLLKHIPYYSHFSLSFLIVDLVDKGDAFPDW
jgi:hypothetical protein